MIRALVAVLALAACEQQPSWLDDLGARSDPTWIAWSKLDYRAQPVGPPADRLKAALRDMHSAPELSRRGADLVAWMEGGGSVPLLGFTWRGIEDPAYLVLPLFMRALDADPGNDRLCEAALYAAWRIRCCDGEGLGAGTLAGAIVKNVIQHRPTPPSFAAKYAATDEEVFRLIVSEAMYFRRAIAETNRADYEHDLVMWLRFANAPTERTAYLAFITRLPAEHPKSLIAPMIESFARKLFEHVDAYNAWLGGEKPK